MHYYVSYSLHFIRFCLSIAPFFGSVIGRTFDTSGIGKMLYSRVLAVGYILFKKSLFLTFIKFSNFFSKNILTNSKKFGIISFACRGVAQFGRVLVSKTMGRGFESFRPCQKVQVIRLGLLFFS